MLLRLQQSFRKRSDGTELYNRILTLEDKVTQLQKTPISGKLRDFDSFVDDHVLATKHDIEHVLSQLTPADPQTMIINRDQCKQCSRNALIEHVKSYLLRSGPKLLCCESKNLYQHPDLCATAIMVHLDDEHEQHEGYYCTNKHIHHSSICINPYIAQSIHVLLCQSLTNPRTMFCKLVTKPTSPVTTKMRKDEINVIYNWRYGAVDVTPYIHTRTVAISEDEKDGADSMYYHLSTISNAAFQKGIYIPIHFLKIHLCYVRHV